MKSSGKRVTLRRTCRAGHKQRYAAHGIVKTYAEIGAAFLYFTCLNLPPSTFHTTYGDSFTSPLASNWIRPRAQLKSLARIAAMTALPSVVPAFWIAWRR